MRGPTRVRSVLTTAAGLLLVAGFACAGAQQAPSATLGQDFTVQAGRAVRMGDTDLSVRFDRVSNDSRCPTNAQCITAGDATVQLTATAGSAAPTVLELHTDGPREVVVSAYRFTLIDLRPLPSVERAVPPGDYVLTLRVSRP